MVHGRAFCPVTKCDYLSCPQVRLLTEQRLFLHESPQPTSSRVPEALVLLNYPIICALSEILFEVVIPLA